MKLITKEIEKYLAKSPLYSQEGKGNNANVYAKFFLPMGYWSWYVTEGEKQPDGDWLFFGLVINGHGEKEWGYFTLSQLEEIELMNGLVKIERDKYFTPATIAECIA